MLSVCIPVYNYNITALIMELSGQLKGINIPSEIIVIDDASDKLYRQLNRQVVKDITYLQLKTNIGRAKIRNKFLEIATYDYLLFIDNDSRIHSSNYIQNYVDEMLKDKKGVIFGGRVFGKRPSTRNHLLRWEYGIKRESKPADIRNLFPHQSFMTNNFLIHRSIFEQVSFNEDLIEYGHEDTLFGYELKKQGVPIEHIENPVLNGDCESNERYLIKTEKAILNLVYMLKYTSDDPEFINDVRLLKCYQKLVSLKISFLIRWMFVLKQPFIRFLLSKGLASMSLFSFYKLGFLMVHYKREGR